MSIVEVREGGLTVRLSTAEKVLALHGDVHVARSQVLRAFSVDDPWHVLRGIRMPGAGLPGVIALGTWRWWGRGTSGRDFCVVRGRGPGVVVDLRDHDFARLLLSVDTPGEVTGPLR
ncbi:MAG TPA: hypothetical protein VFJ12_01780 [Segeticoccus sp.]|nr:hypothetical protein [Segeticoccus sp.]